MLYCITMFIYQRLNLSFFVRLSSSLLLLLLSGCGPFDDPLDLTYTVDAPGGLPCTADAWGRTTCTARIKDYENAYIVFTNPSTTRTAPAAPRVLGLSSGRTAGDAVEPGMEITDILEEPGPRIIDLQMWAAPLPLEEESLSARQGLPALFAEPKAHELESPTNVFRNPLPIERDKPKNPKTIPATLRKKVTASGVTLLVYVADDYWIDTPGTGIVNQSMVNAIADRFLKAGENNDIYDWVTGIYGEHWGGKGRFDNVLSADAAKYITILIDDIYGDGVPTARRDSARTLGYFHSVNSNLSANLAATSNRRLMFVMDAALLAARDPKAAPGTPWDPNYSRPQEIFSTLAHEFLHMVSYYQKRITHTLTAQTQVWLEEMIALVTEDLISDKMGLPGPRGVPLKGGSPDYSPGFPPVHSSRLRAYNSSGSQPGLSLTTNWGKPSHNYSYGISYAFGAYLARNYGGAALFREIVRNGHSDEQAVLAAIKAVTGKSKTFGDLLFEWAAASIKSDNPNSAIPTYNFGGSSGKTNNAEMGGIADTLGSINLYNYPIGTITRNGRRFTVYGPVPFRGNEGAAGFNPDRLRPTPPAANVIFQVGRGLPPGRYSWVVELPQGMTARVVTSLEVSPRVKYAGSGS